MKPGMRLFSNSGCASMGYDLPAAVGAAVASPGVAGHLPGRRRQRDDEHPGAADLQDHRLPVKVFVLDNEGYLSIKQTQRNFFGRESGTSPDCGLEFPDFRAVGAAFGLQSIRLTRDGWRAEVEAFLARPGPGLCAVPLDQTRNSCRASSPGWWTASSARPSSRTCSRSWSARELDRVRDSALAI